GGLLSDERVRRRTDRREDARHALVEGTTGQDRGDRPHRHGRRRLWLSDACRGALPRLRAAPRERRALDQHLQSHGFVAECEAGFAGAGAAREEREVSDARLGAPSRRLADTHFRPRPVVPEPRSLVSNGPWPAGAVSFPPRWNPP